MKFFSHQQHCDEFEEACKWMEDLGVKFTQGRLADYRRDAATISAHDKAGTFAKMLEDHDYRRLLNSQIESREIVGIWHGLRSSQDPNLANELRNIPWGQTMLEDEGADGGNTPRNDTFHLRFKALLAQAGYALKTHSTCDIVVESGGDELMIECKRPFGESGFEKGLSKGKHQLRKHYKEDPTRLGMLAFSVTRIPVLGESWAIEASTESEAAKKTDDRIKEIYNCHRDGCGSFVSQVEKLASDPQTLGVVLYMQTPVYLNRKLVIHEALLFDAIQPKARPVIVEMMVKVNRALGS